VIKVGGKQKPYEMWQAGISLAASPLANSLAGFSREGICSAARPLTNAASYAGYGALKENWCTESAPSYQRGILQDGRLGLTGKSVDMLYFRGLSETATQSFHKGKKLQ